jgi:hypothetical protein
MRKVILIWALAAGAFAGEAKDKYADDREFVVNSVTVAGQWVRMEIEDETAVYQVHGNLWGIAHTPPILRPGAHIRGKRHGSQIDQHFEKDGKIKTGWYVVDAMEIK